jgi:arylsulfatase A-like enzyme
VAFATDAYDDCIADLDEQLGKLVDDLDRRRVLERTWLIIASDHGESFGEHAGVFCHGLSLYDTELHVPLLIIPPGPNATKQIVKEAVSLRDLAATIIDVGGQASGSAFPGNSLARFWDGTMPTPPLQSATAEPALAEVVPNSSAQGNRDSSGLPKSTWPLGAIKDAEWSYIRREGDIREELFRLRDDANEQRNMAGDPAAQTTLQQLRAALDRLTGGPLLPQRFNR